MRRKLLYEYGSGAGARAGTFVRRGGEASGASAPARRDPEAAAQPNPNQLAAAQLTNGTAASAVKASRPNTTTNAEKRRLKKWSSAPNRYATNAPLNTRLKPASPTTGRQRTRASRRRRRCGSVGREAERGTGRETGRELGRKTAMKTNLAFFGRLGGGPRGQQRQQLVLNGLPLVGLVPGRHLANNLGHAQRFVVVQPDV